MKFERHHPSTFNVVDDGSHTRAAGAAIAESIGRRLRAYYTELTAQPVPDRFAELLDRLELQTRKEG